MSSANECSVSFRLKKLVAHCSEMCCTWYDWQSCLNPCILLVHSQR